MIKPLLGPLDFLQKFVHVYSLIKNILNVRLMFSTKMNLLTFDTNFALFKSEMKRVSVVFDT